MSKAHQTIYPPATPSTLAWGSIRCPEPGPRVVSSPRKTPAPMTLDEAILQAENKGCKCGTDHRQIAEWLKELRDRREAE